jgi:hypothetical protein
MLPQLGLAYIFRGQDAGLGESQKGFLAGFQRMGAAVGEVVDRLTSMGDSSKRVLQEQLEQDAADARKSIQSISEGWNDDLKSHVGELVSISQDLKIPAMEVAKTFQNLTNSGLDINKLGGTRGFLEFARVSGVGAAQLSEKLALLAHRNNMSSEQIREMMENMMASGKQFNVGNAGIQRLPEMIDRITKSTSALKDVNISDWIKSESSLGSALSGIFGGADEGFREAAGVTGRITDMRQKIQDLKTGMGTNLSATTEEMAIFSHSVDAAFEAGAKSPREFVRSLLEMSKQADKFGSVYKERFVNALRAGNPQLAAVILDSEKAAKLTEALADQEASMDKNRTDMRDRMKRDVARTSFEDIIKYEGEKFMAEMSKLAPNVSQNLTANIKGELKHFTTMMKEAGKDPHSLLGMLGKGMATVRKEGALAFLPQELKGTVGALSAIKQQLGPTLGMLNEMGINFENLFNPMGWIKMLTGGVIIEFFKNLKQSGGDVTEAFDKTGETIAAWIDKATNFFSGMGEGMSKFLGEHSVVINKLKTSLKKFWNETAIPLAEKAFDKMIDIGSWAVDKLMSKMVDAALNNKAGVAAVSIAALAGGILGFALLGPAGIIPGMKIGALGSLTVQGLMNWFNNRESEKEYNDTLAGRAALRKQLSGVSIQDLLAMRDEKKKEADEGDKRRTNYLEDGTAYTETDEEYNARRKKNKLHEKSNFISKLLVERLNSEEQSELSKASEAVGDNRWADKKIAATAQVQQQIIDKIKSDFSVENEQEQAKMVLQLRAAVEVLKSLKHAADAQVHVAKKALKEHEKANGTAAGPEHTESGPVAPVELIE